jgi:hypothetical protein
MLIHRKSREFFMERAKARSGGLVREKLKRQAEPFRSSKTGAIRIEARDYALGES